MKPCSKYFGRTRQSESGISANECIVPAAKVYNIRPPRSLSHVFYPLSLFSTVPDSKKEVWVKEYSYADRRVIILNQGER